VPLRGGGDGQPADPSPGSVTDCHEDRTRVMPAGGQSQGRTARLVAVRQPRRPPIRDSVRFLRRVRSALTLFMVAAALGAAVAAVTVVALFLAGVAIGHAVG